MVREENKLNYALDHQRRIEEASNTRSKDLTRVTKTRNNTRQY